ncbi:MAG: DUF4139 domain-containing protein [Flavobacteriales bacterium]
MRSILFIGLLLCTSGRLYSQNSSETDIESEVKKVRLYLTAALETRTGKITLEAGQHDVVFRGLPSSLLEESIRANGTGDATILSVSARREYLRPGAERPEAKLIEDSIQVLEFRLNLKNGIKDVLASTRRMILANRSVKGKSTGMEPEDVIELADMYREKLKQMDEKNIENDAEIRKITKRLGVLRQQYEEASGGAKISTSEVLVKVKVNSRTEVNFNLEYITLDAGWIPMYDIRTEGLDSPLLFQFKASVWQNTGTDWKNVDITLSTGNPLESIDKPEIKSLLLSFNAPYRPYRGNVYKSNKDYDGINKNDEVYNERKSQVDELKKQIDQQNMAQQDIYFSTTKGKEETTYGWDQPSNVFRVEQVRGYLDSDAGISTEFLVSTPYSIPSDGKEYNVDVHEKTITCVYRFFAAPAKDPNAFLVARVVGWDQLNLVPATATIFNQGTFVGRIDIDPNTTDDTLEVSLGRDKNIHVQRAPVANKTSRNVSSSSIKEMFAYEIKVANNKTQAIEIYVTDQVPLSPMKDVVVDITETSDADFNKEKGILSWRIKLPPGEKKIMPLEYNVKYPKTYIISNL